MPWLRRLFADLSPLESPLQSQASPCEICGEQSGTGTGYLRELTFFLASIIPPMLHTHSSLTLHKINHPECR